MTPSCSKGIILIQKKLIIITGAPFRAHTEPLYVANKIRNVYDISDYINSLRLSDANMRQ